MQGPFGYPQRKHLLTAAGAAALYWAVPPSPYDRSFSRSLSGVLAAALVGYLYQSWYDNTYNTPVNRDAPPPWPKRLAAGFGRGVGGCG